MLLCNALSSGLLALGTKVLCAREGPRRAFLPHPTSERSTCRDVQRHNFLPCVQSAISSTFNAMCKVQGSTALQRRMASLSAWQTRGDSPVAVFGGWVQAPWLVATDTAGASPGEARACLSADSSVRCQHRRWETSEVPV